VNREVLERAAVQGFSAFLSLAFASPFFGGMIGGSGRLVLAGGGVRGGLGFLFLFELSLEPCDFLGQRPVMGRQRFDGIQQFFDRQFDPFREFLLPQQMLHLFDHRLNVESAHA
jgi:hypothetical protein